MGSRGATFVDASPHAPCPVCGATKRCCRARDGKTVVCFKASTWNGVPGKLLRGFGDRSLGDRWSWYVPGAPVLVQDHAPVPAAPVHEAAAPEVRDKVYRALLDSLELAEDHRVALTAPYPDGRAFPLDEVRRRQYRTLRRGRARVAREVLRVFGADVLGAVPGFYLHEPGASGKPYWSIAGSSGLLVPVRDVSGHVVGMQIRADDPEGQRYTWLSSSSHNGPGSGTPAHVPLRIRPDVVEVRVTEGPLKADAATIHDPEHVLTLAFPGVATWRVILEVLERLGAKTVRIAFDADCTTNRDVGRALRACVAELGTRGYLRVLEIWSKPKGIDDLFASGGSPDVVRD